MNIELEKLAPWNSAKRTTRGGLHRASAFHVTTCPDISGFIGTAGSFNICLLLVTGFSLPFWERKGGIV